MANYQKGRWPHRRLGVLATILFILVTIGVLSACGPGATPVQTIRTVYYMGQHGSVDALQSGDGSLRWHQQLDKGWSTTASLLVVGDVLYVGGQICPSGCPPRSGSVYALKTSDGTVLWRSKAVNVPNDLGQEVQVMAVVNGVVYVGIDGGFPSHAAGEVYALQANNGSLLWHYSVPGPCCRGFVVTRTAVYVGGLNHVDALKPGDGTLLWHHQLDRSTISLGIVVADGVVYVGTVVSNYFSGTHKSAVDALRASDGTLMWHSQTDIASFVLTVADGVVYVGDFLGQTLEALRTSDGSLLWQYKDTDGGDRAIVSATVVDGVAYVTSVTVGYADNGSTLDALQTSNGTHLWRYKIAQGQLKGVAVANGMIYVNTPHGIATLQAGKGNQLWFRADDNVFALAVGP